MVTRRTMSITASLRTPLHSRHLALGARLAPFAGWDMPIQYEGILAEHKRTREDVTVFDICHMGEFDVRGPTAEADLERLVTQNVAGIAIGQARYGFLCNEEGGVEDDLTVYRRGGDHFMLVVNAGTRLGDRDWITSHLSAQTRFADISDATAKLDVQGPKTREAMERIFGQRMPDLKFFRFTDSRVGDVPMTLSRTGYTGEFGYELYFPIGQAGEIWDRLLAGGIKPAGLGARDTLRLEVGYPLYGHELNDLLSPVAATRGSFVDTTKDFIGKARIQQELQQGCARYLCGIVLEGKQAARAEARVLSLDGAEVGMVTSGSIAPSLDRAVALAYVNAGLTTPGTKLSLEIRGKTVPGEVVALPFYKGGSARKN